MQEAFAEQSLFSAAMSSVFSKGPVGPLREPPVESTPMRAGWPGSSSRGSRGRLPEDMVEWSRSAPAAWTGSSKREQNCQLHEAHEGLPMPAGRTGGTSVERASMANAWSPSFLNNFLNKEQRGQLHESMVEHALMQAAQAKQPSSESVIRGQLQSNILELLDFYRRRSLKASGAMPTNGIVHPPNTQISINDALHQEGQQERVTTVDQLEPVSQRLARSAQCKASAFPGPHPDYDIRAAKGDRVNPALDLAIPTPPLLFPEPGDHPEVACLATVQHLQGFPSSGYQDSEVFTSSGYQDSQVQCAREIAAAGGGLSGYATVMIRQVPFKYTQKQLVSEINSNGFDGTYDFFYLPEDAKNNGNRGFGFINFLSANLAAEFYLRYHSQQLKLHQSSTPISVIPAEIQGFDESAESFFNSWHLRKRKRHSMPLFLKPLPAHLSETILARGMADKLFAHASGNKHNASLE